MIVGVPTETAPGERRVALVPELVPKLAKAGVDVIVQSGAGAAAGFLDPAYQGNGARLEPEVFDKADILLKVQPPTADEIGRMKEGSTLIGFLAPGAMKLRENARRSKCQNNMKQIFYALSAYRDDHNEQYPGSLDALGEAYIDDLEVFKCPSSANPVPAAPSGGDYEYSAGLSPASRSTVSYAAVRSPSAT
jgi:hypothetical protein